ncbi:DUF938 domain-containing protein [Agarivorans sp. B2Z047]|uniref:DUF938 domain-containing protein n=1 Tax=Agarivorans sp. B2Z047 TaxID=2652721 RepID=UPI00128C8C9F|nr:DUF938 domain-containing protein [Agarivorans sp. B2Z047]MPW31743.1 DUF938 domain-containing protein [Agarivorans sp. B2Z047]UQN44805.1 class I SAM-dependent methyltransferase [Agarivorans sp. B2Z047]
MTSNQHPAAFFNRAADNNKQAILEQLTPRLTSSWCLLEIGSGTGQHAAFFAKALPQLRWQTSDQQTNDAAIQYWQEYMLLSEQPPPLSYQVGKDVWPCDCDAVYTANTAHIMPKELVELMYSNIGDNLPPKGQLFHYGPFKQAGQYSSESNREFDLMLQAQGYGGLRDIEQLQAWAAKHDLHLKETIAMPANNLLLVWQKA